MGAPPLPQKRRWEPSRRSRLKATLNQVKVGIPFLLLTFITVVGYALTQGVEALLTTDGLVLLGLFIITTGIQTYATLFKYRQGMSTYKIRGIEFHFPNEDYWIPPLKMESFIHFFVVKRFEDYVDFDIWKQLKGTKVYLEPFEQEVNGRRAYGFTYSRPKVVHVEQWYVDTPGVMDYELSHIVMEGVLPGGTEQDFLDWRQARGI